MLQNLLYNTVNCSLLLHNTTYSEIPTGSNEPTVSITPPHEDVTLTAVSHIPGTDANKPPDYNDALKYRKSFDEGYPEPSLVDQPPSYDSVN